MKRGGKFSGTVALLALGACGTQPGLQIRPTAAPLSAQTKPVPIRIAEARAQFALGNVALALESFRKAVREDPTSTDAMLGVAACYDRMGRFDLSRRHYEMALAIAPRDPQLLAAFATSLDLQGASEEAAGVRREIAVRLATDRAPAPAAVASGPKPLPVAMAASPVAVAALPVAKVQPAPQPRAEARAAHPVRMLAAPADLKADEPQLASAAPIAPAAASRAIPVQIAELATPAIETAAVSTAPARPTKRQSLPVPVLEPLSEPEVGRSVTIDLPPPRPAEAVLAHAQSIPQTTPEPDPEPAPAPMVQPQALPTRTTAKAPEKSEPRIERLSMGVVALITGDGPRWEAKTVAKSESSTTLRFVPLREASARPVKVRVLNAARVHRLAARTRSWLTSRGWARMPIGDAPTTRARSLIVYPAGQRELAQTLANQFGFAVEERSDAKFVTMLLGRDAARIEELRPKSA